MGLFDFLLTPPTPEGAAAKLCEYALNDSITESDCALAKALNVETQSFIRERMFFRMAQTLGAIGYMNHPKSHPNITKMGWAAEEIFESHLTKNTALSEQERIVTFAKAKRDYAIEMPETLANTMIKRLTQKAHQPDSTATKQHLTENLKSQTRKILTHAANLADKMRKQWSI